MSDAASSSFLPAVSDKGEVAFSVLTGIALHPTTMCPR